jgi:hypothetical protein
VAVVLLLLSQVALGLPGTLMLLGGWLLAAAISRLVPGLDGPVSWAAAVVVEVALVSTLSAALAKLSAHEHGPFPTLVILASPAILGMAGLLVSLWLGRNNEAKQTRLRRSGRPLIAATVIGAGLIVPIWVASHGVDFRIAWATSGDARNHVLIVRQILGAGGLTLNELRGYPALIDNITGLLTAAGGRHGLLPGQLMLHDIHAVAATYVVTGIGIAVLIVAALLELLPPAVAMAKRLPAALVVVVLASCSLSTTALVLGTSLMDGYLSSYGTLPLGLAAVVLAIRCAGSPSPAAFLLIGPAAILVLFSWTVLAASSTALVFVVAIVLAVRHRAWRAWPPGRDSVAWVISAVISVGSGLLVIGITLTHVTLLHDQFKSSGAVTSPQSRLLWL